MSKGSRIFILWLVVTTLAVDPWILDASSFSSSTASVHQSSSIISSEILSIRNVTSDVLLSSSYKNLSQDHLSATTVSLNGTTLNYLSKDNAESSTSKLSKVSVERTSLYRVETTTVISSYVELHTRSSTSNVFATRTPQSFFTTGTSDIISSPIVTSTENKRPIGQVSNNIISSSQIVVLLSSPSVITSSIPMVRSSTPVYKINASESLNSTVPYSVKVTPGEPSRSFDRKTINSTNTGVSSTRGAVSLSASLSNEHSVSTISDMMLNKTVLKSIGNMTSSTMLYVIGNHRNVTNTSITSNLETNISRTFIDSKSITSRTLNINYNVTIETKLASSSHQLLKNTFSTSRSAVLSSILPGTGNVTFNNKTVVMSSYTSSTQYGFSLTHSLVTPSYPAILSSHQQLLKNTFSTSHSAVLSSILPSTGNVTFDNKTVVMSSYTSSTQYGFSLIHSLVTPSYPAGLSRSRNENLSVSQSTSATSQTSTNIFASGNASRDLNKTNTVLDSAPTVLPSWRYTRNSTVAVPVVETVGSTVTTNIESSVLTTSGYTVLPATTSTVLPIIHQTTLPTIDLNVASTMSSSVSPSVEFNTFSTVNSAVLPAINSTNLSIMKLNVTSTIKSTVIPTVNSKKSTIPISVSLTPSGNSFVTSNSTTWSSSVSVSGKNEHDSVNEISRVQNIHTASSVMLPTGTKIVNTSRTLYNATVNTKTLVPGMNEDQTVATTSANLVSFRGSSVRLVSSKVEQGNISNTILRQSAATQGNMLTSNKHANSTSLRTLPVKSMFPSKEQATETINRTFVSLYSTMIELNTNNTNTQPERTTKSIQGSLLSYSENLIQTPIRTVSLSSISSLPKKVLSVTEVVSLPTTSRNNVSTYTLSLQNSLNKSTKSSLAINSSNAVTGKKSRDLSNKSATSVSLSSFSTDTIFKTKQINESLPMPTSPIVSIITATLPEESHASQSTIRGNKSIPSVPLSKLSGFSLVPIYTPCYISYVITVTQNIVVGKSQSLVNSIRPSSPVISFQNNSQVSSHKIITSVNSRKPTVNQVTVTTLPILESNSGINSTSLSQKQNKTLKLVPTPVSVSTDFNSFLSKSAKLVFTILNTDYSLASITAMKPRYTVNQSDTTLISSSPSNMSSLSSFSTLSQNTTTTMTSSTVVSETSSSMFVNRSLHFPREYNSSQINLAISTSTTSTISPQPSPTLKPTPVMTVSKLNLSSTQSQLKINTAQLDDERNIASSTFNFTSTVNYSAAKLPSYVVVLTNSLNASSVIKIYSKVNLTRSSSAKLSTSLQSENLSSVELLPRQIMSSKMILANNTYSRSVSYNLPSTSIVATLSVNVQTLSEELNFASSASPIRNSTVVPSFAVSVSLGSQHPTMLRPPGSISSSSDVPSSRTSDKSHIMISSFVSFKNISTSSSFIVSQSSSSVELLPRQIMSSKMILANHTYSRNVSYESPSTNIVATSSVDVQTLSEELNFASSASPIRNSTVVPSFTVSTSLGSQHQTMLRPPGSTYLSSNVPSSRTSDKSHIKISSFVSLKNTSTPSSFIASQSSFMRPFNAKSTQLSHNTTTLLSTTKTVLHNTTMITSDAVSLIHATSTLLENTSSFQSRKNSSVKGIHHALSATSQLPSKSGENNTSTKAIGLVVHSTSSLLQTSLVNISQRISPSQFTFNLNAPTPPKSLARTLALGNRSHSNIYSSELWYPAVSTLMLAPSLTTTQFTGYTIATHNVSFRETLISVPSLSDIKVDSSATMGSNFTVYSTNSKPSSRSTKNTGEQTLTEQTSLFTASTPTPPFSILATDTTGGSRHIRSLLLQNSTDLVFPSTTGLHMSSSNASAPKHATSFSTSTEKLFSNSIHPTTTTQPKKWTTFTNVTQEARRKRRDVQDSALQSSKHSQSIVSVFSSSNISVTTVTRSLNLPSSLTGTSSSRYTDPTGSVLLKPSSSYIVEQSTSQSLLETPSLETSIKETSDTFSPPTSYQLMSNKSLVTSRNSFPTVGNQSSLNTNISLSVHSDSYRSLLYLETSGLSSLTTKLIPSRDYSPMNNDTISQLSTSNISKLITTSLAKNVFVETSLSSNAMNNSKRASFGIVSLSYYSINTKTQITVYSTSLQPTGSMYSNIHSDKPATSSGFVLNTQSGSQYPETTMSIRLSQRPSQSNGHSDVLVPKLTPSSSIGLISGNGDHSGSQDPATESTMAIGLSKSYINQSTWSSAVMVPKLSPSSSLKSITGHVNLSSVVKTHLLDSVVLSQVPTITTPGVLGSENNILTTFETPSSLTDFLPQTLALSTNQQTNVLSTIKTSLTGFGQIPSSTPNSRSFVSQNNHLETVVGSYSASLPIPTSTIQKSNNSHGNKPSGSMMISSLTGQNSTISKLSYNQSTLSVLTNSSVQGGAFMSVTTSTTIWQEKREDRKSYTANGPVVSEPVSPSSGPVYSTRRQSNASSSRISATFSASKSHNSKSIDQNTASFRSYQKASKNVTSLSVNPSPLFNATQSQSSHLQVSPSAQMDKNQTTFISDISRNTPRLSNFEVPSTIRITLSPYSFMPSVSNSIQSSQLLSNTVTRAVTPGSLTNISQLSRFSGRASTLLETTTSYATHPTRSSSTLKNINETSSHVYSNSTHRTVSGSDILSPSPSLTHDSNARDVASTRNSIFKKSISTNIVNYSRSVSSSGSSEMRKNRSTLLTSYHVSLPLSSSPPTSSAAVKTFSSVRISSLPSFIYNIIPTSSLGMCIAGYVTVRVQNYSETVSLSISKSLQDTSPSSSPPNVTFWESVSHSITISPNATYPSETALPNYTSHLVLNMSSLTTSSQNSNMPSLTSNSQKSNMSSLTTSSQNSNISSLTTSPQNSNISSLTTIPQNSNTPSLTTSPQNSIMPSLTTSPQNSNMPSLSSMYTLNVTTTFIASTVVTSIVATASENIGNFSSASLISLSGTQTTLQRNMSSNYKNTETESVETLFPSTILSGSPVPVSLTPVLSSSVPTTPNISMVSSVKYITPSLSSVVHSSSPVVTPVPTSIPEVDENFLLWISLEVSIKMNVSTGQFSQNIENKLTYVYIKAKIVESWRRKRSTPPDTYAKVTSLERKKGTKVDVMFIIIEKNKTVSAVDAAMTMNEFNTERMSSMIGYPVLSRPHAVSNDVLAILIKTTNQKNISIPSNKKDLEDRLARIYNSSENEQESKDIKATISNVYFEPLDRTYFEFAILIDKFRRVDQSTLLQAFNLSLNMLTARLHQEVLVAPYIPGLFSPTTTDYIVQNMKLNGIVELQTIEEKKALKKDLSRKIALVYLRAKQKQPKRRRRRAFGSIDSVITGLSWTKNPYADVTYYIIDGGSILNATYACSILNRLTINEISGITAPYTMSTSPAPVQPLTSKNTGDSDDSGDPSWMIPVVLGGSVGLLLLIIIIILYCRWKKGAPSKKVGPPQAEDQERPRITNAADPGQRSNVRHHPPVASTSVAVHDNGTERPTEKPPLRKLPVRENSLRKKVIISQTTRPNPAFIEDNDDVANVMNPNVVSRRPRNTKNDLVNNNNVNGVPRRTVVPPAPPSIPETLSESDGESETEFSEEESMNTTRDSVFTTNTEQHSAAALPTIAVMSDTRPPRQPPPVRFRTTVHPEASLPPLELKQTSLVGRVVEEEGPLQQQMKSKADIERWRNKQRQREKNRNESHSKPDQKQSLTEKKAWSRAQQEIGSVLDPDAMQPIAVKKKRKLRRKYNMKVDTTDGEENVELRGFHKLTSPREDKNTSHEQETGSESDFSMGEAQRRIMTLLDDAFSSMKPKRHSSESAEKQKAMADNQAHQSYINSGYRPPLYPRPLTTALPEPAPAHGRATAPSARHKRRMLNASSTSPYSPGYHPGHSGRYHPLYQPPAVVTKSPVVVWDPADKQRLLNQSSYRPYPGNPYTYTDPTGKLHFTRVQHTPDGMGGLVWSPYATEYAMEDFHRNVAVPLDDQMPFQMQPEPTLTALPDENPGLPNDTVDMGPSNTTNGDTIPRTGESGEPLVRAIKDELFRLSSGRSPVDH